MLTVDFASYHTTVLLHLPIVSITSFEPTEICGLRSHVRTEWFRSSLVNHSRFLSTYPPVFNLHYTMECQRLKLFNRRSTLHHLNTIDYYCHQHWLVVFHDRKVKAQGFRMLLSCLASDLRYIVKSTVPYFIPTNHSTFSICNNV